VNVAAAVAVALSAATNAQGTAPARPNVLIITVDTLRPDALGWAGGKNSTPHIDALAGEGFRFPGAVAPVPLTLPSHSALMTGWWPRRLGLRDNGQLLPPSVPTLAEAFKKSGYQTAAFVSGYPLDSAFGLDRGFDHYDDALVRGEEGDLERPADATAGAFVSWVGAARAPWFAWVHFYDPHYPYLPPPPHRRAGARGTYDGEVAFVDAAIGQMRQALGASSAPLLTVFTADHGESLGEHGEGTHGFFIYDSTVLVPLVFHLPGRVTSASSAMPARLIDVGPTVLRLAGVPAPGPMDGVSLHAQLAGGPARPEPAYVETQQPWVSYGWAPLRAMRHGAWKLIEAPRPELYDLAADPGETRNLFAAQAARAESLRRLLDRAESLPAASAPRLEDPEAMERLRALGYVGSAPASGAAPAAGLRDPKDAGPLRDKLTQADLLFRRRQFAAALAPLDDVLAQERDNRFALYRAGVSHTELGRLARALPLLGRLVRLDPLNPEGRTALADALVRARRPADSVPHWLEATRLQPRRADHWANLGSALGLARREKDAADALAQAVRLQPRDPALLIRLGFAEAAGGRPADAARHLLAAADLAGPAFPHAGALGVLLARQGRAEEARTWLARAGRQDGDFAEARYQLALLEADAGRSDAARAALSEALSAAPGLRARAAADSRLSRLLP
jgi:arylsulfatase A-like enzyme/predicted Zn-dependent protease